MNRDIPGRELTLRGLVLGVALTLIFTAANIYLGLKVGLTFATSIPAAVISMAFLGLFSGSNIRENNIVQTVCSSAGAMASIIFVLPGLVIVGFWTGFPFWTSFLLTLAGGVLGVMFTIPLRRGLVTNSDLPYPEGVAGAEVLRVGSDTRAANPEAREGLLAVIYGSLASAGLAIAVSMRLALDSATGFFRLPWGASGYSFAWSLALFGAGHLVGISVGVAMALGIAIGWLGAVPILASMTPQHAALGDFVTNVWSSQVRYVGAGAMGVAAIWSLLRTLRPILSGLAHVARARAVQLDPGDHTDRDISFSWVIALSVAAVALAAALTWRFAADAGLGGTAMSIALVAIPIITLFGFLVAAICGYMAGLIGSSNSPISGVGILAVTGCAVFLAVFFSHAPAHAMVAVALFITSILFAAACSSNDNLQDLKTGQLVGAAPWRQQVALLVGVMASSVVVPLVLNLLAKAYGFAGAANLGTVTAQPLAAPQANLISALAQGVIGGQINWNLIGAGALVGVGIVALDELSRARGWMRMPPLAVGFGIYLPMSATLPVAAGALVGWLYNRRSATARSERLGVLMASGLIVGESLFGVINAGLIVGAGRDAPLAVVPDGFAAAPLLGLLGFAGLVVLLYGWLLKMARHA
ncbi:MAG: oligopeptide transporter, OPT family [Alphaproteobacteria bacterium 64-11]|nr:oligopeptide transporter, OPT family [Alphaproteobacteria bacterium]OJU11476.1 MAG: oligopeptide transporter, OPT family [Alphaproteobacteria bacterium 64-11]